MRVADVMANRHVEAFVRRLCADAAREGVDRQQRGWTEGRQRDLPACPSDR